MSQRFVQPAVGVTITQAPSSAILLDSESWREWEDRKGGRDSRSSSRDTVTLSPEVKSGIAHSHRWEAIRPWDATPEIGRASCRERV